MKRPRLLFGAAAFALTALSFAAGFAVARRSQRSELAGATVEAALSHAATLQFTLSMLEQQRGAQLSPQLEKQLVSAIGRAHRAISVYGLPAQHVWPNQVEAMRRSGAYLAQRGVHPEAVQQAQWVVAQFNNAS